MKQKLWILVAVLMVLGALGIAAVAFARDASEKARLAELLARVENACQEDPKDEDACRKLPALLAELAQDPQAKMDPGLVRGRSRILFLLGRAQDAWEILEPSVLTAAPASPDLLLGAEILKQRFEEAGSLDLAEKGFSLAEAHHENTGELRSLYLAWLTALRLVQADPGEVWETRVEGLAKKIFSAFENSTQAQIVASLAGYPEVDALIVKELRRLEQEAEEVPEELELALAWKGVEGSEEQIRQALERVERVLTTFPNSVVARFLAGTAYLRLKNEERSHFHLDWLLRRYPDHANAKVWRALRNAKIQEKSK